VDTVDIIEPETDTVEPEPLDLRANAVCDGQLKQVG
jgi:hypothetical protein